MLNAFGSSPTRPRTGCFFYRLTLKDRNSAVWTQRQHTNLRGVSFRYDAGAMILDSGYRLRRHQVALNAFGIFGIAISILVAVSALKVCRNLSLFWTKIYLNARMWEKLHRSHPFHCVEFFGRTWKFREVSTARCRHLSSFTYRYVHCLRETNYRNIYMILAFFSPWNWRAIDTYKYWRIWSVSTSGITSLSQALNRLEFVFFAMSLISSTRRLVLLVDARIIPQTG